jgi:phage terminase Nu1 subunit (DNA packaging protein)
MAQAKPMSADAKTPSVDVGTLAKLFSLTSVRVQQLAVDGIITKQERGRYDLWSSIRGYIKYLQERKVNQWSGGEDQDGDQYHKHRSRLTKAKADIAEIEAEAMKGKFHEAGAVEAVWADMLMNARSKMLAIPSKLAPKLRKETEIQAIKDALEKAIHECLHELAEYDPDIITSQYLQTHMPDVEASAEADGVGMG